MQTSFTDQIKAIQSARRLIGKILKEDGIINLREFNLIEIDKGLNDAGSTIAAINLEKSDKIK